MTVDAWRQNMAPSRQRGDAMQMTGDEVCVLFVAREDAASRTAGLTPRQREILKLVLTGHPSEIIAWELGISRRTVENHRALIMRKTGSKSVPALVRLAIAAT